VIAFEVYIGCGFNPELAINAAMSFKAQVLPEGYRARAVILNNSEKPMPTVVDGADDFEVLEPPVKLTMAQMANWMAKLAAQRGLPFFGSMHDDATVLPGAFADILRKWEQVKAEKWVTIGLCGFHDVVGIWNQEAYHRENVWWDGFLFPLYHVDCHFYRTMGLRGWHIYNSDTPGLATHLGSSVIHQDPVMHRKVQLMFHRSEQIYQDIWGGLLGSETNDDPMANGTCYPPSINLSEVAK